MYCAPYTLTSVSVSALALAPDVEQALAQVAAAVVHVAVPAEPDVAAVQALVAAAAA